MTDVVVEQSISIDRIEKRTEHKRRSIFPGKENVGLSFNLTALGRQLFKEQSNAANLSNADYLERLVRERELVGPLQLNGIVKGTGPKGGAKSYFYGKNRGKTTAVSATTTARRLVDEQCKAARMSRGDYVEFLLREKAGLLNKTLPEDCDFVESAVQLGNIESIV